MKRTTLIAAIVSLIPLAASAVSANADPYYRGYGHGYRPAPPVVRIVPARPHFGFHRDWHPRRHWGMHRGWYGNRGWR